MSRPAYLYILHATGSDWYKIGVTSREVKDRISQMQTGNPYRIEEFASVPMPEDVAYRVEAWCHEAFASVRGTGEWFTLTREMAKDLYAMLSHAERIEAAADLARTALSVPVTILQITPAGERFGIWCAYMARFAEGEYERVGTEFAVTAAETFTSVQSASPEEAVGLLLRLWRYELTDDCAGALEAIEYRESDDLSALLRSLRLLGSFAAGEFERMNEARRTQPLSPDLDGLVVTHEGVIAAACPACGSGNLKDKGTSEKCMDCGHRISVASDE